MPDSHPLDLGEPLERLDASPILSLLQHFDGQLSEALVLSRQLDTVPWISRKAPPRQVVLCGMGGSAIGGDLVRDLCGDELAVPFVVNRGYRPGRVDSRTLVILSSYSGDTAETLTCYSRARGQGAMLLGLTSGGRLLEDCRRHQTPVVLLPGGYPPRCALGFSFVMLLKLLECLHVAPRFDVAAWGPRIRSRTAALGPGISIRTNPAKQLAERLHGRMLLIYGSQGRLGAVARRWAGQFNENAKQLARFGEIPEMNHNEVAGWKHPSDGLTGLAAVFLRDREEHPEVARRFEWTADLVRERAGHCENVWSEGEDWAERLWSLILLGDFASVYAAILNEENPARIDSIDELKLHLNETSRQGD